MLYDYLSRNHTMRKLLFTSALIVFCAGGTAAAGFALDSDRIMGEPQKRHAGHAAAMVLTALFAGCSFCTAVLLIEEQAGRID